MAVTSLALLAAVARARIVAPALRIILDDFRGDLVGEAPGAEEFLMRRIGASTWPKKIS